MPIKIRQCRKKPICYAKQENVLDREVTFYVKTAPLHRPTLIIHFGKGRLLASLSAIRDYATQVGAEEKHGHQELATATEANRTDSDLWLTDYGYK